MKKLLFAAPVALLLLGCPAAIQNASDFGPAAQCVADELAVGGIEDPIALMAKCGITLIENLIRYIGDLLKNQAPASSVDGGALAASPAREAYIAHLNKVLANAQALQKAGHP